MNIPASWFMRDANRPRLSIGTTDTTLSSPDGQTEVTTDNIGMYLTSRGYSAFDADASSTTLWTPDNNGYLELANTGLIYNDGTRNRIELTATNSNLISPNGQKAINISNSIIDNQTTWFNIGDGVRTRFNTTTTQVGMYSPNGVNNVVSSNTGTVIGGATSVCDGLGSNSFTIMPYAEHYSGGSLTLVGADKNDEPLTYYENYHIDNFWGYMRIYTSGNSTKYIRMQNVSDIATSPNKKLILELSGNQTIVGDQGFNASGETATLYMGDTNSYLQAKHSTGLIIGSAGSTTIKFVAQDRIRVNYIETELISPAEVYSVTVRDAYVNVWDGSRHRIVVNDTMSQLTSPDGTTVLEVTDSTVKVTGLPTSDPVDAGALWVDSSAGYVVKVSQG